MKKIIIMSMSTLVFFISANETVIKTSHQKIQQQEKVKTEILTSENKQLQRKALVPEKKKVKNKSYPRGNIATH